ncbi:MFS transporter [Nocardiopsis chromatogenes]|uniref:hypothetical protein n=1 Tax=Nocardiopsis chromatogenes TaxID=280239 RepID=UPI00034CC29B|nr:hypothetical protein [Nocardiopsis chromatogenes]
MLGLYALGTALIAVGLGRVPFVAVLAVAAATGLAAPAVAGVWTSRLAGAVPAALLPRANSLDALTYSAAGLAGPAIAASAAWAVGPWGALAAAVLLIGAATPFAGERGRGGAKGGTTPLRSDLPPPPTPSRLAAELFDGLRAVAGRRPLARATAATTLSLAASGMVVVCWPLLGAELLGAPERGTLLLSVAAVSAIAANALLARRPSALAPDTLLWVCGAALCAVPLLAACARALPPGSATAAALVLGLAAAVAGAAEGPQLTALFAVRHRDAPAAVRARVFAIGAGLKVSGMAAGAAIAGALAERGTGAALAAAAGAEALAFAAFAALTLLHPDRPQPPEAAHNGQEFV